MLAKRVLTAAVLVPVLVAAVLSGQGWPLVLLAGAVVVLCAREYHRMFLSAPRDRRSGVALTALAYVACVLLPVPLAVAALLACVVLATFHVLPGGAPAADKARTAGAIVLGVVYIGASLAMYPRVRALPRGEHWVLFGLVAVSLGDAVAYFVGRAVGRRPLSPISPNKTVEGAAGGLAGSIVLGGAYAAWFLPSVPLWFAAAAAAALGVIGQGGDLFESLLKRAAGVKDSGTLLPGHGGMFDRADAVIAAGPALYFVAALAPFLGGRG
ncbi:MAG: phosphatidate cytidylyltransferase [Gemmatimonadota bacterium]